MRRVPVLLAALLVPALAAACAVAGTGGTPVPVPAVRPAATPASAVGALFGGPASNIGSHFCSASVIDSPGGDVVLTAAHCVADGDGTPARTGMSFVPGYHDGLRPYGVWTVTSAAVDPRFLESADPDYDVAFLTVAPTGTEAAVQDVTGGFPVAFDPGIGDQVKAIGYPMENDAPTIRSGVTQQYSPTQLELPAPGLEDGTSGGPWLRGTTGNAQIVGLTGGYEQGGYSFDTSYSTYLAGSFADLRAAAESVSGVAPTPTPVVRAAG